MERNPRIAQARAELATRTFVQPEHWRILFIGRSVNGSTDIVSCLSRSLRNLGHRVLDIDLKRHRHLAQNPTMAKGGNGPIYLDIDAMRPLLQRFRPQLIVCCAGGLTFREDDAAALKKNGAVLLGLTLSDPDVFPSIHPHAHVFDFHTTNARIAMQMYRDAGVENTLYFPFGIDRGFVTQSVPRAPELQADVICIGHATARPERNEVMVRLARDLDVRTYGRGWALPGSEVVEGRRMVQASREGRIHVNFPMTRAGYINIKCGVFESIGSGGLVATGRFPEMEDFFSYDEEIVGYHDEEDLAQQLQTLLADPERYRAMTERAFDRLINEHLYEHRWQALLGQIRSIARAGGSWLGQERSQQVAGILSESLPKARHVLLSGYYGASNVGDELILRSISERLEAADPAVQVWVGAENTDQVEINHGLQSFQRKSLPDALHAARTASAVVLGGGGLWHDYTFERSGGLLGLFDTPQISIAGFGALPLMCRMFDVPFHVVGMGIGPMTDPDARRMMRFVGRHAESIMVRDAESAAHAAAFDGLPVEVSQAPDVVYGLALSPSAVPPDIEAFRQRGYRIVGLNLRPWAHTDEDALVESVRNALAEAASRQPLALVGIPMQAGERVDTAVLGRVAAALGDSVPALVLRAPLSTEQLIDTLASLDVLVSMRLHACLLAHRLGRPVVGIAYDPKVVNHFSELERALFCLPLPLDDAAFASALAAALSEEARLPAATQSRLRDLERRASSALDAAAMRIVSAPARETVFEVPRPSQRLQPAPPAHAAAVAVAAKPTPGAAGRGLVAAPEIRPGKARFVDASIFVSGGIRLGSAAAHSGERVVQIGLPVERPMQGDGIEVKGMIEVQGEGDVELAMRLESPYQNPKAAGRIRLVCEFGEYWRLEEDLAADARPVQLRIFAGAPIRIPFKLALWVDKNAFASRTWPRQSRVSLRLLSAIASDHGCTVSVLASRGAQAEAG